MRKRERARDWNLSLNIGRREMGQCANVEHYSPTMGGCVCTLSQYTGATQVGTKEE